MQRVLWERGGKGKEECWVLFVFLKMTFLKLIKIRENQCDCKIVSQLQKKPLYRSYLCIRIPSTSSNSWIYHAFSLKSVNRNYFDTCQIISLYTHCYHATNNQMISTHIFKVSLSHRCQCSHQMHNCKAFTRPKQDTDFGFYSEKSIH